MKDLVFEKYQIRKTKKQKSNFIELVKDHSKNLGYDCRIEKGKFGSRNVVIGDVDSAKVIYTAHYDTCPVLPFPNFITPKNFGIYILYNIVIVLALMLLAGVIGVIMNVAVNLLWNIDGISSIISSAVFINMSSYLLDFLYLFLLILLLFGPANKNTANDNTSGVMTLLTLMKEMPVELREKCAFVFFDLEEVGLIGSADFASKHKSIKKNTLVVNYDCVSDGDNFIITLSKTVHEKAELFEKAYSSERFNVEVLKKGYFYPSDQSKFKKGVAVAALKKSKSFGILYMDRIHTKKDTVYQEENIEYLVNASVRLTEMI